MFFLYQKFISVIIIFAVFLFGNMAIVHAGSTPHTEIISHSHDGITESHIIETADNREPPHCTKTQIDTTIAQQVRDNIELPHLSLRSISVYSEYDDSSYLLTQDTYFQHYPGSENNFFGHLLVGEKKILI